LGFDRLGCICFWVFGLLGNEGVGGKVRERGRSNPMRAYAESNVSYRIGNGSSFARGLPVDGCRSPKATREWRRRSVRLKNEERFNILAEKVASGSVIPNEQFWSELDWRSNG
jgi:hypothetical protein